MQAGEERTSIDSASVARTRELLDDRNMLQRVNECWSIFPSTMSSRIVLYSLMFFPKLRTFQDIDWKNLIVIQRLYAKLSITSDTPTRYQSPLCWPIIIFHDPGQNIPINLRNHLHAKKESPPSIHSPQVNELTACYSPRKYESSACFSKGEASERRTSNGNAIFLFLRRGSSMKIRYIRQRAIFIVKPRDRVKTLSSYRDEWPWPETFSRRKRY